LKNIARVLLLGMLPVVALAAELPASLQGLGLRESAVASRDLPGWKKPEKVLVHTLFGPQVLAPLQAAAPGVELVPVKTLEDTAQALSGAQALISFCQPGMLDGADQLLWVHSYLAGVEDCVALPAVKAGVVLTNGQRLGGSTIAEHAIALTFALVRGIDGFHAQQASGNWNRNAATSLRGFGELSGRTMLVVGLGGIGTQVAQRAHALGMRVIATRGSRREGPDYVAYVGLADEAQKLAREADVVVNAAPLTAATTGMFDREFFAAMKPSAYFVSVGRGRSTVTDDLVAALRSGQIAGAGLDVTEPEPLPPDHALWTAPRVIITPHVAAMSTESLQRMLTLAGENLRRYVAGEPLLSVVDVERGY
jgi:phosphoglycerate dehydrogenase-like enzyme